MDFWLLSKTSLLFWACFFMLHDADVSLGTLWVKLFSSVHSPAQEGCVCFSVSDWGCQSGWLSFILPCITERVPVALLALDLCHQSSATSVTVCVMHCSFNLYFSWLLIRLPFTCHWPLIFMILGMSCSSLLSVFQLFDFFLLIDVSIIYKFCTWAFVDICGV